MFCLAGWLAGLLRPGYIMSRQRIRRAISEWDCLGADPHWQPVPHPLYTTEPSHHSRPHRPRHAHAPPAAMERASSAGRIHHMDPRAHRIPVHVVKTSNGRRVVTPVTPERLERNNNNNTLHMPDKYHGQHPPNPKYFTHSKSMESIDGNWTLKSRDGQKAERNRKTNLAVWNAQVSQKFEEMKAREGSQQSDGSRSHTAPRPSTTTSSRPSPGYSSQDTARSSPRYPVGMAVAKSGPQSSTSTTSSHSSRPPCVVLERGGQTFMYVHDKHGYQPVTTSMAAETLTNQSSSSSHKYVKNSAIGYAEPPPRLKPTGKSNSTPNLLDDIADMENVFVGEDYGPKSSTPRDYINAAITTNVTHSGTTTRDYASQTVPRNFNSSREDILQGEVVRVQVPGYTNGNSRHDSTTNGTTQNRSSNGHGNHSNGNNGTSASGLSAHSGRQRHHSDPTLLDAGAGVGGEVDHISPHRAPAPSKHLDPAWYVPQHTQHKVPEQLGSKVECLC